MDEDILRGNAAILKCQIPSFVADFVEIVAWEREDGQTYSSSRSQNYHGTFHFGSQVLFSFYTHSDRVSNVPNPIII